MTGEDDGDIMESTDAPIDIDDLNEKAYMQTAMDDTVNRYVLYNDIQPAGAQGLS